MNGLFFPPPVAMPASGGLSSLIYFDRATSQLPQSNSTLNWPSGVQAGDIAIRQWFTDYSYVDGVVQTLSASGFTTIDQRTSGANFAAMRRGYCGIRLCTGSESGSVGNLTGAGPYSGDTPSSPSVGGHLLTVLRPNVPIAAISVQNAGGAIVDANPTARTVTASGGTKPLVVLGLYHAVGGAVDPRTFTPAKDDEISGGLSNNRIYCAWKMYGPSDTPVNHSIDMDDEGVNYLASCYVELS